MANAKRPRRVEFKIGNIIRKTSRKTSQAMKQLANEMATDIKKRLNVPFPPPSRPGGFPHKRTGFLQDNTNATGQGKRVIIRTPQYGIWLDGGTSRMAARPFIRRRIHNRRKFWTTRLRKILKSLS